MIELSRSELNIQQSEWLEYMDQNIQKLEWPD